MMGDLDAELFLIILFQQTCEPYTIGFYNNIYEPIQKFGLPKVIRHNLNSSIICIYL